MKCAVYYGLVILALSVSGAQSSLFSRSAKDDHVEEAKKHVGAAAEPEHEATIVDGIIDKTKSGYERTMDYIHGNHHNAAGGSASTAESMKQKVADNMPGSNSASQTLHNVVDQGANKIKEGIDSVQSAKRKVGEKIPNNAADAGETLGSYVDQGAEMLKEGIERVKQGFAEEKKKEL
jgi:uncharacterized protein with GYD domain